MRKLFNSKKTNILHRRVQGGGRPAVLLGTNRSGTTRLRQHQIRHEEELLVPQQEARGVHQGGDRGDEGREGDLPTGKWRGSCHLI